MEIPVLFSETLTEWTIPIYVPMINRIHEIDLMIIGGEYPLSFFRSFQTRQSIGYDLSYSDDPSYSLSLLYLFFLKTPS